MLDIRFIKENAQAVKENMQKKNRTDLEIVDSLLAMDTQYRQELAKAQELRTLRNKLSQQVNTLKKEGKDVKEVIAQVQAIPQQIADIEVVTEKLKGDILAIQKKIPVLIHPDVPLGKDDSQNVELQRFGDTPTREVPTHQDIMKNLGVADFDSAAQVAGNGFYYIQGDLALLNQALLRFGIDTMVRHGFLYVETPFMLRGDVIKNVVSLADQEGQIYKINDEDLYLIGTSEHSLIGRYLQTTVAEEKLPIKHTSYSMCFRREKGSHGIDERGLFRTHQFNKVEMIVICKPEESMAFYHKLYNITLEIFKALEIPCRTLGICSGDLGDMKHIQVDVEAWSPRRKAFFEVGSCSNLVDAQSRQLGIKATRKDGTTYHPHTLNNTAIATSRAMVAILENHYQPDGSVAIPKVLQPFMGGKTHIRPIDK